MDATANIRKSLGPEAQKKIDYVRKVFGPAVMAGERLGVDPKFLMGQAALESGWGKSDLASKYNNFGGVKAVAGQPSVSLSSMEGAGKAQKPVVSAFAVYESPNQFFESWTEFLGKPRYQQAREAKTPEAYAYGLKKGGYYTDSASKYANILSRTTRDIDKIISNLDKLDPSIIESRMAGQAGTR
jgi:flagellar protein FlgJ